MNKAWLLVLLCCGIPGWSAAQMSDSTQAENERSNVVDEHRFEFKHYSLAEFGFDSIVYHHADTQLHGIWLYDPALATAQYAHLGVLGSAARPLWLSSGRFRAFALGFEQYNAYVYQATDRSYWQVSKPLTHFDFTSGGGNNQQVFKVFHTQNIGKTVNIGVDYRLMSSDGYYASQKTNNRNLALFGSMVSPDRKYAAHLNYTTNNNQDEQNGGIQPGRLFEEGLFIQPLGVPVNLNRARSRYNDRNWFLEQRYRLTGSDSSHRGLVAFHRSHYQQQYYTYAHQNSQQPYYPTVLRDPTNTFDSSAARMYTHALGLRNEHVPGGLSWEAGINKQHGRVQTDSLPLQQQLWWVHGQIFAPLVAGMYGKVEVNRVLSNRLQANTGSLSAALGYRTNSQTSFELQYLQQSQTATWLSQRYEGNHQQFNNNFAPITEQSLLLTVQLPLLQLQASRRNIAQWVYFDSLGQAQQHAPQLSVWQVGYSGLFKFWKFKLDVHHGWQWVADGPLRAPRFFNRDILSIAHRFKAGWELELGTDFRFQSGYLAPGFRPEIGQFVVQDSLMAGNHPIFDLFAAIKVKRTRLFVRFEHANQGFPAPNFYAVPLYPMYSRAFRFGVSWAFYN
jgi:hypothetical protein